MVDRTTYTDEAHTPKLALRQIFGRQGLKSELCVAAADSGLLSVEVFAMLGDTAAAAKTALRAIVPDSSLGATVGERELAVMQLASVWLACQALQTQFATRRARMEEDPNKIPEMAQEDHAEFRARFVRSHPDVILIDAKEPHKKFVEKLNRDYLVNGMVPFYTMAEVDNRSSSEPDSAHATLAAKIATAPYVKAEASYLESQKEYQRAAAAWKAKEAEEQQSVDQLQGFVDQFRMSGIESKAATYAAEAESHAKRAEEWRVRKMEDMAAARATWVEQPLPQTEPHELVSSLTACTIKPKIADLKSAVKQLSNDEVLGFVKGLVERYEYPRERFYCSVWLAEVIDEKHRRCPRLRAELRQMCPKVETELRILNSEEVLTLPVVTSTKVIELKEYLSLRLGVDTSDLHFVRRKVTVHGIRSFKPERATYSNPFLIIGAGHIGLRHGLYLLQRDFTNFLIVDRRNKVGGTSWISQANKTSKLQTELGTYHLQCLECSAEHPGQCVFAMSVPLALTGHLEPMGMEEAPSDTFADATGDSTSSLSRLSSFSALMKLPCYTSSQDGGRVAVAEMFKTFECNRASNFARFWCGLTQRMIRFGWDGFVFMSGNWLSARRVLHVFDDVPKNMKTWPSRDELLEHFAQVSDEFGLTPYIRLSTNVTRMEIQGKTSADGPLGVAHLEAVDPSYSGVDTPEPTGKNVESMTVSCAFMYPGNLSLPRLHSYHGEDLLPALHANRARRYAMFDNVDYDAVARGKTVMIAGHGAFGVENIRTCCEFSAKKIYLVCRRKNLACPRVCSWPGALFMESMVPAYDLIGFDPWSYHSVMANQQRTSVHINQKSRFGIGDVYFLALSMGKCEVVVDEVKRLTKQKVHLESGRDLEVHTILKVFGFTGLYEVDRLLKIKTMSGFWAENDNRRYIASESPGVYAANFAGTSLSPGDGAYSWAQTATHVMWFPKDWQRLVEHGTLPQNKADDEISRPAYVLDAKTALTMQFTIPVTCPALGEIMARNGIVKILRCKHDIGAPNCLAQKQRLCHPMRRFLEECAEEWEWYGKTWKEEDPSLKDVPPYPYTVAMVQGFLKRSESPTLLLQLKRHIHAGQVLDCLGKWRTVQALHEAHAAGRPMPNEAGDEDEEDENEEDQGEDEGDEKDDERDEDSDFSDHLANNENVSHGICVNMSPTQEQGDEDDDDGGGQHGGGAWGAEWTARKAAASSLDNLSHMYRENILEVVLPLISKKLEHESWEVQESGVLALGAIAFGCMEGLTQYMPKVMEHLLKLCQAPKPLLRSISCWTSPAFCRTVARFSSWICNERVNPMSEQVLRSVLQQLLLRVLDKNKRVQEAACSAFATLEEMARHLLVPYLDDIVQTLSKAFQYYQAKNLLILYDAVGTLADAVGPELDTQRYKQLLLEPLFQKFNNTPDNDRSIIALFECLSSMAQNLGPSFMPLCKPLVERCSRLIINGAQAAQMWMQNPNEFEKPDREVMAASIDLLSGIVAGLQGKVAEVLQQQNFLSVVPEVLKDSALQVKQSAFALVGDSAKHCIEHLAPFLPQLLPQCAKALRENTSATVSNNASWAVGEICIKVGADFMANYLDEVVDALISSLRSTQPSQRQALLMQNVCITLGRLGVVCGPSMGKKFGQFAQICYAPTNRAKCKGKCGEKIEKGAIRLGTSSDGMGDYTIASYRCLKCVTDKQFSNIINKVGSIESVAGWDVLTAKDKAAVLKQAGVKPAAKGAAKAAASSPARKAKAKPEPKPKAARAPKAKPKPAAKRAAKAPAIAKQHEFLDKAKEYDLEGVKAMLEETPELVNVQPAGRWSALHQFAENGDADAVRYLLEMGADRDAKNKEGQTPLEEEGEDEEAEEEAEDEEEAEEPPKEEEKKGTKRKAEPEPKAKAAASAATPSPAKKAKTPRPVDVEVPNRDKYSVVDDWSVLLNQTNLLKDEHDKIYCFTRWGRVGVAGQSNLALCGNQANGESTFKAKFKDKSGVHYDMKDSHDWKPTVGKYTIVNTEEQEGGGGDSAPLGKLTEQQIEKGQVDTGAEEELLKFYLRMGFEELDKEEEGLLPISGVMSLALPPSLESACSGVCTAASLKSSMTNGKKHAEKQSGDPTKRLAELYGEPHLYGALMLYTSNAIYRQLNAALRSEDRNKIKKYKPYLRLLFEALNRLPQQKRT
eukprot:g31129.t1